MPSIPTIEDLTHAIEKLTNSILEKLEKHELEGIDNLINKRLYFISELCSIVGKKEQLRSIIKNIEQQNDLINAAIQKEQQKIKKILGNFTQLDQYLK